jgi:hypothetical protein
MFKLFPTFFVVAAGFTLALPLDAQQKGPVSPHDKVGAVIAGNRVTIYYGRPYTKSPKTGEMRKIWGGLVPWEKAWRAGADEATTLITEGELKVGDKSIPAGAYTLYMIPSEKGATKLAVSKKIGQWGIKKDGTVDETGEFVRVDMKKDSAEKKLEQFTIQLAVTKGQPKADLIMTWDDTRFSVPIEVVKK